MHKKNWLSSGLVFLSVSVFISVVVAVPIFAQEMPSRVQTGQAMERVALRSTSAPVMAVSIAPSAKELLASAQADLNQAGGTAPLAKVLGIKAPHGPAVPLRVGAVLASKAAPQVAQWESQTDGSYITHIRIASANARGIRARLQLPPDMTVGEMRVAAHHGDVATALPLSVSRNGEIWTPYTEGSTQIVEIQVRRQVPGDLIEVAAIGHFEMALSSLGNRDTPVLMATGPGTAGRCSPDIVCTANNTGIDTALEERRKSVARMSFSSGGQMLICTGTLMNSPVQQNFFLTANHCISTQAEANILSTTWFYQSSGCGVVAGSGQQVELGGGAQLVFTNQFVDSTLLRLNSAPPAGSVFSGWNAAPMDVNSSVISVSHPSGDYMKYATGTVSSLQGRTDGLYRVVGFEQDFYAVIFNRGVTEGGSSGSGIFTVANGTSQLRGVLSGSSTLNSTEGLSCSNINENALYGRYDYFYPQIAPLLNGQNYPVDDFPNQPSATGLALLPGATVSGLLGYVGDIDVFRIPVVQAGTLFAKSAGGYDLIGNLMDANGKTLQTNDDSFSNNNEFGISWQVSPGIHYLAVAAFDPAVVTSSAYSISTSFTTATSNHTSLWWGGEAQSGWGVNVNQQGNTIFATMFNYEAAGLGNQNSGMWLVSTGTRLGAADSFSGDLLRVNGPAFNATPFTPITTANTTRVGNMRFDFTGVNSGTLTYDVIGAGTGGTGSTVTKSISRQAFGVLPVCEFSGSDRSRVPNYQDLWWNPNESGWGINFTHQGDTIFATLFTYEAGAGSLNKGMWLTATMARQSGTQIFLGDALRVSGSAFNANPFVPLNPATNVTRVGSMLIEFTDGNSAQLIYDVNGQQVTKAIERQVFDAFRPECSAP